MSLRERVAERFHAERGRLARLVAVLGLLVVVGNLVAHLPREVVLRYDLGPGHASVSGLEVVYRASDPTAADSDDILASARFGFGDEGPRLVEHSLRLPAGAYDVRATLDTSLGPVRYVRHFVAPADGVVRLELFELELAHGPGAAPETRCHHDALNPTNSRTSLPWHPCMAVLAWHSALRSADGAVSRSPQTHRAAQRHRSES